MKAKEFFDKEGATYFEILCLSDPEKLTIFKFAEEYATHSHTALISKLEGLKMKSAFGHRNGIIDLCIKEIKG